MIGVPLSFHPLPDHCRRRFFFFFLVTSDLRSIGLNQATLVAICVLYAIKFQLYIITSFALRLFMYVPLGGGGSAG